MCIFLNILCFIHSTRCRSLAHENLLLLFIISHLLYIVLSPLDFQAILINISLVVCYNIYSDTYVLD